MALKACVILLLIALSARLAPSSCGVPYYKPPHRTFIRKSRSGNKLTGLSKIMIPCCIGYCMQGAFPPTTSLLCRSTDAVMKYPLTNFYRLLSCSLVHGDAMHLFSNMYSLKAIGPEVESCFNERRFVDLYLASTLCSSVVSTAASNLRLPGAARLSVGASGGVMGLLGGYYVFLSVNRRFFRPRGVQAGMSSLRKTAVINLGYGFLASRIDNYAHVGGIIGGAAYSYLFGPRLKISNGLVVDEPKMWQKREKPPGVKLRKILVVG